MSGPLRGGLDADCASNCGSHNPGLGTKNAVVAIISMSPVGGFHSREGREVYEDRKEEAHTIRECLEHCLQFGGMSVDS